MAELWSGLNKPHSPQKGWSWYLLFAARQNGVESIVQRTVEEILVVCTTTAEWSIEVIAIQTVVGVAVDKRPRRFQSWCLCALFYSPMVFPSLHR